MKAIALLAALVMAGTSAWAGDRTAIEETIRIAIPAARNAGIDPSPVPGISEVTVGTQVLYVTDDGQFVFAGPLIRTADSSNLTEGRIARARAELLTKQAGLRMYRYPADPARHRITVFTDIDCPYCRRLHNDLPGYQQAGIDVTYVMLPRSGIGSASYLKTVSAVCSADPEAAITAAMQGADPAPAQCDHPIDHHLALARQLGLSSTPSIVLPDGRLVLGHKKPAELLGLLEP